jgi:hypothetical protein
VRNWHPGSAHMESERAIHYRFSTHRIRRGSAASALACPAMRIGDPVQLMENGKIVTGTIAASMYGAVQVRRSL